jgi:anti-anti-sigma regulatory factor
MLRITVLNEPGITRMKLEGKLAHEWVDEARNAWTALTKMNGDSDIVVDLLDVSFVDDAGHLLLAEIRHAGAELMASGPLMLALIDEIEEAESLDS